MLTSVYNIIHECREVCSVYQLVLISGAIVLVVSNNVNNALSGLADKS